MTIKTSLNKESCCVFSFPCCSRLIPRFSDIICSSSEVKEWIFRLTSLICNIMVWGFGISLATSRYWRLWEFDSNVIHRMYIGLWEAYYYQEVNKSGSIARVPVHSAMNSNWTISMEIEYARGLMVLSNFMQPVVIVFSSLTIMICWIKAPYPEFLIMCYKTAVFVQVLNMICIVLAVSWNYVMDIYGESTLDFPQMFPVTKDDLLRKQKTHVFPQGILTAVLSAVSVLMMLYEIRLKARVRMSIVSIDSSLDLGWGFLDLQYLSKDSFKIFPTYA